MNISVYRSLYLFYLLNYHDLLVFKNAVSLHIQGCNVLIYKNNGNTVFLFLLVSGYHRLIMSITISLIVFILKEELL